jgi:hypothetical protein
MRLPFLPLLSLLPLTLAHGTHNTHGLHDDHDDPDPNLSWAERHLISEHHINNYDAGAFFALHDFDQDHFLTRDEILRTYGAAFPSAEYDQDKIWNTIAEMIDTDHDNELSYAEWMAWSRSGGVLPDFGTGIGHHGDDESEYEIHHFEKFHSHDKEDGSDMVMHQEDIDHVSYPQRRGNGWG